MDKEYKIRMQKTGRCKMCLHDIVKSTLKEGVCLRCRLGGDRDPLIDPRSVSTGRIGGGKLV